MLESEMRELSGHGGPAQVSFAGKSWAVRADGLAALLRYAQAGMAPPEEHRSPLAAMHRLLEDCITDFAGFSAAAFSSRVQDEEILDAARQLTRLYCARSHWEATRLIGFLAASLEELDGRLLLATGRGMASLSAREACNLAVTVCLEGRTEEDRDIFMEDLKFEGDPEGDALAAVRQMTADRKAREAEAAGG
jgi:hypothetical protein